MVIDDGYRMVGRTPDWTVGKAPCADHVSAACTCTAAQGASCRRGEKNAEGTIERSIGLYTKAGASWQAGPHVSDELSHVSTASVAKQKPEAAHRTRLEGRVEGRGERGRERRKRFMRCRCETGRPFLLPHRLARNKFPRQARISSPAAHATESPSPWPKPSEKCCKPSSSQEWYGPHGFGEDSRLLAEARAKTILHLVPFIPGHQLAS